MTRLELMIKALPPDLQHEVEDYVGFLLEKRMRKPAGPLGLAWRGALRHLRDRYTSVELQHKALDWRDDDVSAGH